MTFAYTDSHLPFWEITPRSHPWLPGFPSLSRFLGSAWPVVKLAASHGTWLGMAKMLLAHVSAGKQAGIFNANAARAYRLG